MFLESHREEASDPETVEKFSSIDWRMKGSVTSVKNEGK